MQGGIFLVALSNNIFHVLMTREGQSDLSATLFLFLQFSPMSGAVFGSTELKINGRDLGKAKEDIGNITVAGQPCQFLPKLYVPSKT